MFHDVSGLLAVFQNSPTLLADDLHFATDAEGCRDSGIRRRADATGRVCHTGTHTGHGSPVLHRNRVESKIDVISADVR